MRTNTKWVILTFFIIVGVDVILDCGKWALGRHTVVSTFISIFTIVGFSAALACIVEFIHKIRRRRERQHEQYVHHKAKVWVVKGQKGNHWRSSLCPDCQNFYPDSPDNCLIESTVHITSRDNNLTLVIWECPDFKVKTR